MNREEIERSPALMPRLVMGEAVTFGAIVLISVLGAHALDFFLHEYAHATMAWALGWKADPLALHYGHATLDNILLQQQIDENVAYGPIFASHHGGEAALIAAAGPIIANSGAALLCNRAIEAMARQTAHTAGRKAVIWGMTWIAAFNVFNLWSYAPLRVLTDHGDMALIAQGLGISRWVMFPFVTCLALGLVLRFVTATLPRAQRGVGFGPLGRWLGLAVLLTAAPFFSMAGLAGDYGTASAVLGIVSLFGFAPALLLAYGRRMPFTVMKV